MIQDGPLRCAVLGLGVGEVHARALVEAGCELRQVYDPDAHKAWEVATAHHCLAAQHVEDIFDDGAVDLVVIASPDDMHARQVLAALKAGKHVFVEKPVCLTVHDLRRIHRAWSAHGGRVKLLSNHILRAAPLYQRVKADVDAGRLGTLYALDGEYLYGRLEKITNGWRGQIPDYSVFLGGGIHMADLMLWLAGERPVAVRARGNALCSHPHRLGFNDFAVAELVFPSGMVGRLAANFGCVQPHQHVLRVYGTKGTVLYDDAGARTYTSRSPETPHTPLAESPHPEHKGALLMQFVRWIAEDKDLAPMTQEVFDAVSVCLACDKAAATGEEMEMEYV